VSAVACTLTQCEGARFGLKGSRAPMWLEERGIQIPNSWSALTHDDTEVIVRLGSSEFLIEHTTKSDRAIALRSALSASTVGVYPVLREDACLELAGCVVHDVLAQVCNVSFAELPFAERHAVMTMMIGVAVTVVPLGNAAQPRYRIWCDPSFGHYLGGSLQQIVNESSGGWREHQNSG
jgi:sarcosine oxidase subunit gamma